MARVLRITGGGSLELIDSAGRALALRAPSGLAGDVNLELPDADGAASAVLKTDGSGKLSFTKTLGDLTLTQLTIDNQGELRLREASGGGTNYTGFQAPAALAGDVIYTLPDADGAADSFLKTDGAGTLSWAAGSSTLQQAYDAGNTIAVAGANSVDLTSALGIDLLTLTQSGAGRSLYINHSGAETALRVDQSAAQNGIGINKTNAGGGDALSIVDAGATGYSIEITKSGDATAIYVNKTATGAGTVFQIDNAGSGDTMLLQSTKAASTSRVLRLVQQADEEALQIDHTGSSGRGIQVNQAAADYGIYVVQTGDSNALRLSSGRPSACAFIDYNGTGNSLAITHTGTGVAVAINKDLIGAGAVIGITNAGTGPDILGDSSAWRVEKNGAVYLKGLHGSWENKTISSGQITTSEDEFLIRLEPESGTSDTLDTIAGAADGQVLILCTSSAGDTITISEAGNIQVPGASVALDNPNDKVMLVYDSNNTKWSVVSFSDNA